MLRILIAKNDHSQLLCFFLYFTFFNSWEEFTKVADRLKKFFGLLEIRVDYMVIVAIPRILEQQSLTNLVTPIIVVMLSKFSSLHQESLNQV